MINIHAAANLVIKVRETMENCRAREEMHKQSCQIVRWLKVPRSGLSKGGGFLNGAHRIQAALPMNPVSFLKVSNEEQRGVLEEQEDGGINFNAILPQGLGIKD